MLINVGFKPCDREFWTKFSIKFWAVGFLLFFSTFFFFFVFFFFLFTVFIFFFLANLLQLRHLLQSCLKKKIFIYHGIIWYTFWPFILLLFKNLSFLFHTINFYPSFSISFLRLRMTNTAAVYRSNPLKLNYKYLPSFGDDISGLKFLQYLCFSGV